MRPTRREVIGVAVSSLAVAGCVGGTGGGSDGTETAVDATVGVYNHEDFGQILVGPDGMTLYLFEQDSKGGGQSACTGGCADAWPPLTVDGSPSAGSDVTAELSTFERGDGSLQVAANGWPLYYFQSDEAVGDATGQGVNDVWWVLGPDGSPAKASNTATGTKTDAGPY